MRFFRFVSFSDCFERIAVKRREQCRHTSKTGPENRCLDYKAFAEAPSAWNSTSKLEPQLSNSSPSRNDTCQFSAIPYIETLPLVEMFTYPFGQSLAFLLERCSCRFTKIDVNALQLLVIIIGQLEITMIFFVIESVVHWLEPAEVIRGGWIDRPWRCRRVHLARNCCAVRYKLPTLADWAITRVVDMFLRIADGSEISKIQKEKKTFFSINMSWMELNLFFKF